ncbi:MAG TPA: hypothetical protein VFQ61_00585 [Polyangiaceae bacterium]|nr:hypothetical protein [Polyangiaceae bacterium]
MTFPRPPKRCRRSADLGAARRHLELAREWPARTGEVEVALSVWELEARIALSAADRRAAMSAIDEGRALSAACGFGAFTERFDRLASTVS